MNVPVHIVSLGARTPVGMQAAPAAAAIRAGISRLAEHPYMVDQAGEPMAAALDQRLDPGCTGFERMLALADTALRQACEPLLGDVGAAIRAPLYVALPEFRPGFTASDARAIREGLARFAGLPLDISEVQILAEGHAAGLAGLATAVREIRSGIVDAYLVGGVESYVHPDTMEWLDANRQLTGSVSRSGFVPGEGAGFCLLMADSLRRHLGLSSLGRVLSVASGKESKLIKTSEVCLGEGLTATVREVLGDLQPAGAPIDAIICDMNSERYRGEEWGFVCLRMPYSFADPTAYLSPAEFWGDMGAASGPLFAVLACHGAAPASTRGTRTRTLLWASSEGGLRSAAVLETDGRAQGRIGCGN